MTSFVYFGVLEGFEGEEAVVKLRSLKSAAIRIKVPSEFGRESFQFVPEMKQYVFFVGVNRFVKAIVWVEAFDCNGSQTKTYRAATFRDLDFLHIY